MRVFLTGGTGLVGSHVAERVRSEGHDVLALVRPGSDVRHLRRLGCETVEGDLTGAAGALPRVMEGCSHVVHAAALVYAGGSWAEIEAVNVGGTRAVMSAAVEIGAHGTVHVSSVAVYGRGTAHVDDATPEAELPPATSDYARSKKMAETVARAAARRAGMRLTILRPASMYGERDRLMTRRVARLTRWPVSLTLGPGHNTIPTVYAGNVADAVWRALVANPAEATYDVAFDHPITQRMLLEGIARGMGRRSRVVPVPASVVRGTGWALERLGVPTPGVPGLPLGRVVALGLADNPYRSGRIRDELGWDPPHRHEEALVRTGAWLARATSERLDRPGVSA